MGGNATAAINASGAGILTVTSEADGGGNANNFFGAAAIPGSGLADSYASTTSLTPGGSSMKAKASTASGVVSAVTATASGPIISNVGGHVEAFTDAGHRPRAASLANGIHAAAFAELPNGIGTSDVFGTMTLSAASAGATLTSQIYTSQVDWSLNVMLVPESTKHLLIGNTSASSAGDGSVSFRILENGATTKDYEFATFAAATTFFESESEDLGPINLLPRMQSIFSPLSFVLNVTTSQAGAYFDPRYFLRHDAPRPTTRRLEPRCPRQCR